MLKTILITAFKLTIVGALLAWLLQSGKLDFSLLGKLSDYPLAVLTTVVLTVFNFWLISIRWRFVLSSRSQAHFPLTGLLRITWIGTFFSSILPGSVSGDLVKILYIQKYDANLSKKFIFASILIDRVMGLAALILMVGCTSLIFSKHILTEAPAMAPLLRMNYILSTGVILGFLLFSFCHHWVRAIFLQGEKLFLPQVWQKLIALWDDLILIRKEMLKALGISFVVQVNAVVLFWSVIKPFVEGHLDFIQALTFIPLGNVTLALPIAPSGLGVGHAIFQKLFEFSGISNGASLFNLYFVVSLCVNVLGFIPYIITKTKENPQ
jgi:glycosyltransferase 2 family protein